MLATHLLIKTNSYMENQSRNKNVDSNNHNISKADRCPARRKATRALWSAEMRLHRNTSKSNFDESALFGTWWARMMHICIRQSQHVQRRLDASRCLSLPAMNSILQGNTCHEPIPQIWVALTAGPAITPMQPLQSDPPWPWRIQPYSCRFYLLPLLSGTPRGIQQQP